AAMRTVLGMDVVLDESGVRRRFRPKDAWMLAVLLAAAIGGRALARGAAAPPPFAPVQERLGVMLPLRNPPPRLSVLGFEFGDPLLAWVVHDPCSLRETAETGKRNCLTVTFAMTFPTKEEAQTYLDENRERLEQAP